MNHLKDKFPRDPRRQHDVDTRRVRFFQIMAGTALAVLVTIGILTGYLFEERVTDNRETNRHQAAVQRSLVNQTGELRRLACGIADLVAHVPSVQFQGETLKNFTGWVNSRHKLLVSARANSTCSPQVLKTLNARIIADEALLRKARKRLERKARQKRRQKAAHELKKQRDRASPGGGGGGAVNGGGTPTRPSPDKRKKGGNRAPAPAPAPVIPVPAPPISPGNSDVCIKNPQAGVCDRLN